MLPRAEIENLLTAVFEAVDLAAEGRVADGHQALLLGKQRAKAALIVAPLLRRRRPTGPLPLPCSEGPLNTVSRSAAPRYLHSQRAGSSGGVVYDRHRVSGTSTVM